jgi:hypothetical protein
MTQKQISNERIKHKLLNGNIKNVSTQTGNSNEVIIYGKIKFSIKHITFQYI